jgi:hypothetical protein
MKAVLAVALGIGLTAGLRLAEAGSPDRVKPGPESRSAMIDDLIKSAWDAAKVKPSRVCSDEEFLRRAYLDVLGRIPNIKEAQSFLSARGSDKRQKLVDRLLEHPDFARNLATEWSVTLLGRREAERRVDRSALTEWLRRQFTDNRTWDAIVSDLITAKGNNKTNGAVNFKLAHLEPDAVPLTSMTARVFLGQQLQCTQCHDHPSNPWKQADFWALNAFFKGLRREEAEGGGTELIDEPSDAFSQYDRRNGLVGVAFPRYLDGRKVSPGADVNRRVVLAGYIADKKNDQLARAFVNRTWAQFMGRGFVNPVDDFGPHNEPILPELLERLAVAFRDSGYDVKALVRSIISSRTYNLSSVTIKGNEKDDGLFSHMALKPMTPEQLFESLLTATSAHTAGGGNGSGARRDAWLRQFIFAFATDEGDEGTSFQGTIPQALMMMNGDLITRATGGEPGSFLADLRSRALNEPEPVAFMVNGLYLAALSRYPTYKESEQAAHYLDAFPDTIEVLQDLFWALLNSNEFVLNH